MATTTDKKTTKTEAVRAILEEIGAVTESPPEGWRKQVEERLAKQKIKIHTVTIYQIRQKALKDQRQANRNGSTNGRKKFTPGQLTLADVQEINKFAQQYGGLKALAGAIHDIQNIFGN